MAHYGFLLSQGIWGRSSELSIHLLSWVLNSNEVKLTTQTPQKITEREKRDERSTSFARQQCNRINALVKKLYLSLMRADCWALYSWWNKQENHQHSKPIYLSFLSPCHPFPSEFLFPLSLLKL